MRRKVGVVVVSFGVMLSAISLAAHHSFAEYDPNKPLMVKGTVSKVEWTNPHVRIYVDGKDAQGTVNTWNFEMASTIALQRGGWSRNTLPVGTEVTVVGVAARNGEPRGSARSITTADGKSLFIASPTS